MIITWTYGAVSQDVQQAFGSISNWSSIPVEVLAGPWNFTELVVWSPGAVTGKATQPGAVTGLMSDPGFTTGLAVGTLKD